MPGSVPPPPSPSAARSRIESEPAEEDEERGVLRGGSRPPYKSEPSHLVFRTDSLRRPDGGIELAEALSLPPELHGMGPVSSPSSAAEARVFFTTLARELGREYRERFGIELRTDLRGLEIVQRELAERFADRDVLAAEDVNDVRRSGAFVSEMLARRLGAEWVDLASGDIGHWAMSIPSGASSPPSVRSTTVWPIGRVIRFVSMRHRERDLTSYFLELQARAHGLG
jgi:hypothetical protein